MASSALLEGVEGLLDGGIADGMNGELIAFCMVIVHEVVHLVVVQEHQTGGLGLSDIGLGHGGGPPAGAAVGEDLHRPDAQHGIAHARHHPIGIGLLHDASRPAEQALGRPHGQPAEALRRAIGGDLAVARPHADACIHDAGNAVGQACAAGIVDGLNEFLVRRLRQHGLEAVTPGLGQQARQSSVPLLDGASLRNGRRLVDSRKLESLRIADRHMAAGSHDRNGMFGSRRIELFAERMAPDIEFELIVSAPLDPLTGRRNGSALPDLVEQRGEGWRGRRTHVHMSHDHPIGEKVHMRVAQPRSRKTSCKIDHAGRRTDERFHVGGRPCRQDLPCPEGDCFGDLF